MLQACTGNQDSAYIDTDKAVAYHASAAPEKEDVKFAVAAANMNLTETVLGKLAQKNGRDLKVKNFGTMLIKDLAKNSKKLTALAKAKHITLPETPEAADKKTIDSLTQIPANNFDKAYISTMTARHKNDIQVFETASKYCFDPDIKKFAAQTLPRLKNHLDAINKVNEMMGDRSK